MKKINKLLALVLALAMVLALAGCGSEGKTSAADASGSAAPAASASGSAADDQPAAEQTLFISTSPPLWRPSLWIRSSLSSRRRILT